MTTTPMTRSRKRERAAKLTLADRLELAAKKQAAVLEERAEVGFEKLVRWSMGFWETGPGQLTLLLGCVGMVVLSCLIEKAF